MPSVVDQHAVSICILVTYLPYAVYAMARTVPTVKNMNAGRSTVRHLHPCMSDHFRRASIESRPSRSLVPLALLPLESDFGLEPIDRDRPSPMIFTSGNAFPPTGMWAIARARPSAWKVIAATGGFGLEEEAYRR